MHIGCHGRRELGVFDHPLKLLQSVRGLTYCELPNIEECCGFGGTFSVKMPGTSLAMGQSKKENIVRSGAEVVVSGDISCLMHIGGMLAARPGHAAYPHDAPGRSARCGRYHRGLRTEKLKT